MPVAARRRRSALNLCGDLPGVGASCSAGCCGGVGGCSCFAASANPRIGSCRSRPPFKRPPMAVGARERAESSAESSESSSSAPPLRRRTGVSRTASIADPAGGARSLGVRITRFGIGSGGRGGMRGWRCSSSFCAAARASASACASSSSLSLSHAAGTAEAISVSETTAGLQASTRAARRVAGRSAARSVRSTCPARLARCSPVSVASGGGGKKPGSCADGRAGAACRGRGSGGEEGGGEGGCGCCGCSI